MLSWICKRRICSIVRGMSSILRWYVWVRGTMPWCDVQVWLQYEYVYYVIEPLRGTLIGNVTSLIVYILWLYIRSWYKVQFLGCGVPGGISLIAEIIAVWSFYILFHINSNVHVILCRLTVSVTLKLLTAIFVYLYFVKFVQVIFIWRIREYNMTMVSEP